MAEKKKILVDGLTNVTFYAMTETSDGMTIQRTLKGKAKQHLGFGQLQTLRDVTLTGTNPYNIRTYGYYKAHSSMAGADNGVGGSYTMIELQTIDLAVEMKNGYYSTFTPTNNSTTLPLEKKENKRGTTDETYKTWWNHHVVSTNSSAKLTSAQETQWKAQTSIKAPYATKTESFIKTNQAIPKEINILIPADKPGVQGFIYPTLTVVENLYTKSKKIANETVDAVGFLKVPKNHLDKNYDDTKTSFANWLITGARYRKNFGWYECEITYKYVDQGWNQDLYAKW